MSDNENRSSAHGRRYGRADVQGNSSDACVDEVIKQFRGKLRWLAAARPVAFAVSFYDAVRLHCATADYVVQLPLDPPFEQYIKTEHSIEVTDTSNGYKIIYEKSVTYVVFLNRKGSDEALARLKDDINSTTRISSARQRFLKAAEQMSVGQLEALAVVAENILKGEATQPIDPVYADIAARVTTKWADRKRDHAGEPWIKNASRFVAHVYKEWLDAGTLKQRHLMHDPMLYQSYAKHISLKPEDDLHLEKAQGRQFSMSRQP